MATSREDIRRWFEAGRKNAERPHYMVVVCDTFDYDDYPVYPQDEVEARKLLKEPGEMQRVMEVYDLRVDMESQLAQRRCFALT